MKTKTEKPQPTEAEQFDRAVQTAHETIEVQKKTRIESARLPFVISRKDSTTKAEGTFERFEVLGLDAWVPHTGSLMGWGEPTAWKSTQVAMVMLDGSVRRIEDDELVRMCEGNADFTEAVEAAKVLKPRGQSNNVAIVITVHPSGDATFEAMISPTEQQLADQQVPAGTITRRVVARVDYRGIVKPAFA